MNPMFFLVVCGIAIVGLQKMASNMEANLDSTTSLSQYVSNYALHSTVRVVRLAIMFFAVSLLLVIAILISIQNLGGVTSAELTNAINVVDHLRDLSRGLNSRISMLVFTGLMLVVITYAYHRAKTVGQQSVLRMFHLDIQQPPTELEEMLEFFIGRTLVNKLRYAPKIFFRASFLMLIPVTVAIFAPFIGQIVEHKEIELQSHMNTVKIDELNRDIRNTVQSLAHTIATAKKINMQIVLNACYSVTAEPYNFLVNPYLIQIGEKTLVRFLSFEKP